MTATVGEIVAQFDEWYPPALAADWDRIGLVVGDPDASVRSALFVIDCVPSTVAEAVDAGVDLVIAHHPLLFRPVASVARTSYKGRIVHDLITHGIALHVAHTNADRAPGGVADALAGAIGLRDVGAFGSPEVPGRIGRLGVPLSLADFTAHVAASLPATAAGVRAGGDPNAPITTVALCPGAGDEFLAAAYEVGVDAYLTADLRHHPAADHLDRGGPALVEAAHWATEWPWLPVAAARLREATGVTGLVSRLPTDPWTVHCAGVA